jgi:hypothetical protein
MQHRSVKVIGVSTALSGAGEITVGVLDGKLAIVTGASRGELGAAAPAGR